MRFAIAASRRSSPSGERNEAIAASATRERDCPRHNGRLLPIIWRQCGDNGFYQPLCLQQKSEPQAAIMLIFLRKSGAGEGIRTLDPNLGKAANRLGWQIVKEAATG
ncbi:hypothetical protein [Sphingobium quisquiliarum]|uniref:hypothetical protein n=1 Tax=Sphingobium quisquiliarum TaxID=538379 RepID=UPI00146D61A3|nr:hypothetical protein [Sphingobium quisquiliarum]